MSINVNDKNIGHATAYAYYKAGGGTMTEAEFTEFMADFGTASQTAVEAAQAALASQNAAQTAATTATNKASEAATSATTATTAAEAAQADADAAALDASQALSAASTATTKASEATTAAATATSAKTDAVAAKTAAQTAQTAAETAQGKAETAQEAAEDAAESVSASAAQIATNTADITELNTHLTQKANIDGSYEDLVSGGAYQIISNMEEVDNTPYGYRTAGGSLEIGDREKLKKIVGASAAVNQLVQNGNFANTDNWSATNATGFSVSDGVASFTPTALYGNIHQFLSGKPLKANHVILCIGDMKADGALENCQLTISDNINFTRAKTVTLSTAWQTIFLMIKETTVAYSNNHTVAFRTFLTSDFAKMYAKNAMIIDLTAMFGSTIADYVYSLETATAGAGVAWLKSHFPKIFDSGYIPYNAGTLEHVSGLSAHKMTGFNQWDEEWELGQYNTSTGAKSGNSGQIRCKNYIQILPSTTYYVNSSSNTNAYFKPLFYDANKNYIGTVDSFRNNTFTTPSNAHYMTFYMNSSYGTTYLNNICINLHWDGERDGEYEPYEEHSYPLDSDVTLRGIPKLDANNNLYYDGDEYEPDGTVTRRYGIVDLGTLTWSASSAYGSVYRSDAQVDDPKNDSLSTGYYAPMIISSSSLKHSLYVADASANATAGLIGIRYNKIFVTFAESKTAAEVKTALNGIYVLYQLATPTTESADPYTEIQNVSNWGTEEFVTTSLVPVGHETAYQPDLRAKIEVAPESPDTDGLYLMKRENGQNSYVAYLGELPSDPTTDGTYTLKCTVASGTATKTWEADE